MMIQQRYMNGMINRVYYFSMCLITVLIYLLLYLQTPDKPNQMNASENFEYAFNSGLKISLQNAIASTLRDNNSQHKYLVHSSKCKIPNLSPFNSEVMAFFNPKTYINCTDKPLLTYLTRKNNVATLHIDERYKSYYGRGIHCCSSYISRGETDDDLNRDWCVEFKDQVVLKHHTLLVICVDENSNKVYQNIHTTIIIDDKVKKKLRKQKNRRPLSVLLVAIDGVSRLNFIRSLPKTHDFLKKNDWLEFQGYNKMADNTFPNVMAILTGLNESTVYKRCNPKVLGMLDGCNLIWYDYARLGFVTAYAEDEADTSTFNTRKKGFQYEPTDYYLRSYIYGSETYLVCRIIDRLTYCTGPENSGERIFKVARDFLSTFKNYSTFGVFWMNSYSHNVVNAVSRMDDKILDFFKDVSEATLIDNSVVIFLSDHGCRVGEYTYTTAGWLEERLPFFYMSLPNWFKRKYPKKYTNLIGNTKKLTSPYDLYVTLQEILVLSGRNYAVKNSSGCPKCESLFSEIESERSCEDSGIPIHWCACTGYLSISSKSLLAEEAAKFIISKIHRAIFDSGGDFDKCVNLKLNQIISASIADTVKNTVQGKVYLLVVFETYPKAFFEGTLSLNLSLSMPTFTMEEGISRLDFYKESSWCANDDTLKKYCYCKRTLNNFFKALIERIYK